MLERAAQTADRFNSSSLSAHHCIIFTRPKTPRAHTEDGVALDMGKLRLNRVRIP